MPEADIKTRAKNSTKPASEPSASRLQQPARKSRSVRLEDGPCTVLPSSVEGNKVRISSGYTITGQTTKTSYSSIIRNQSECRRILQIISEAYPRLSLKISIEKAISLSILPSDFDFEAWLDANTKLPRHKIATNSAKKPAPVIPPPPPGFVWPKETYSEAHKARKVHIIEFLEDPLGWFPLISNGQLDLKTLRLVDRSAANAINAYTKPHPKTGVRRELPPHLLVPTVSDLTDRKIKEAGGIEAALADPSLAHTIGGRLLRGTRIPGL